MVCNFNTNCTTDECSDDVTDINTCDCNDKNIILPESGLLPKNFTDFYICSTHFNQLLKRNSDLRRRKVCQLPTLISAHPPVASHSVVGVKKPKPSRNITINDVEKIQKCYGLTLPIGTPACTSCLIKISKQSTEIEAESLDQGKCEDDQIQQCTNLNTDDETYLMETDELDMLTEKENICDNLIEISASEYTVTSEESGSQNYLSQSQQSVRSYERGSYLTSLNDFLSSVRLQEFSEKERKTWQSYTFKTRNTYKERIDEIMKLIIGILFPNDVDEVIEDIKCPKQLNEENRTDHTEYKDIVTSYRKAESWQQGRQVLSVLASRMSFKDLLSLLPEVTSHRYYAALSHSKKIGPALPIPDKKLHRQKLDPERLDSFLDFITSSHVVRDLPFGEKKLKFSDGTVHNLPNVVRCMGSADIIQQYKAYCQENEVLLLGDSTMFKILAQCGAKVRKSLEGLDYFVAEGGRAFITLQDVLDKLLTYDAISPDDHKSFQALFLQSKQYLRTDYKIHISKGREVADHCMLYALSDEKDEAFIEQCSHNHQMVCESCEQLKETIAALEKIFVTSSVDGKEDEMNDLNFRVQQATRNIFSLKKHIIRCKNQDLAKTHLFETMPTDEVLLVCDWAMKFLPRKFREDQCDWFGKRGIPWHISIAFCRKDDGSIGSLGFVHLFATQISQDSRVTASIIQDVMDKIREINTTDIKFHVWSDNAGCYKSTEMLSFLFHSGLILSYDFCESQNGKGPCDRTAATIKSSIRRYVNQGHDVLTAQSMKKAIDKSAKNVKYIVRVIEGTECRKTKYTPIPAIYGITAWKAYQVGTGKLIPSSNIPTVEKCILNTSCSEIEGEIDVVYHQLPLKAEEEENTITCANEGCTLSFSSFHELSSHLMFGKCEFEFRCQFSNGCDITKKTYITKMSKSFSTNFQVSSAGLTVGIDDNSDLELGWALKEERKNKRFNVNQKEYLTEKFNKGLKTGRKEDPFLVSEEMLTERKEDGNRRFSYDEILSVQQITSFFSRMSRKNKSFDDSVDASREETITTIRRELTADELN